MTLLVTKGPGKKIKVVPLKEPEPIKEPEPAQPKVPA